MPTEAETTVVLVHDGIEVASWPLASLAQAGGLAAVDELARLALAARRLGCSIALRAACAPLCELLDLAGLGDVVPQLGSLRIEPVREAEDGEQAGI